MMGFAMLAIPTTVAAPRTVPSGAKRGRQLLRTTAPSTVNRGAQLNTSALRSERSLRNAGRSLRTSHPPSCSPLLAPFTLPSQARLTPTSEHLPLCASLTTLKAGHIYTQGGQEHTPRIHIRTVDRPHPPAGAGPATTL